MASPIDPEADFPGSPCAFWLDSIDAMTDVPAGPLPLRTVEAMKEDDDRLEALENGDELAPPPHPWCRDRILTARNPAEFWKQINSLDTRKLRSLFNSSVYFCTTVDELDDDILIPPTWEQNPMGFTATLVPPTVDAGAIGWVDMAWQRLCCALLVTSVSLAERSEEPNEGAFPYANGVFGVSCNGDVVKVWLRSAPPAGASEVPPQEAITQVFLPWLRTILGCPNLYVSVKSNQQAITDQRLADARRASHKRTTSNQSGSTVTRGHGRYGSNQSDASSTMSFREAPPKLTSASRPPPRMSHPTRNSAMVQSAPYLSVPSPDGSPPGKAILTPLTGSRRTQTSSFGQVGTSSIGSNGGSSNGPTTPLVGSLHHSRQPSHQRQDSTLTQNSDGSMSASITSLGGHRHRKRGSRAGKQKKAQQERKSFDDGITEVEAQVHDPYNWTKAAVSGVPEPQNEVSWGEIAPDLDKASGARDSLPPLTPHSRTNHVRQVSFQFENSMDSTRIHKDDDEDSVVFRESDDDNELPQFATGFVRADRAPYDPNRRGSGSTSISPQNSSLDPSAGLSEVRSAMRNPKLSADDILLYRKKAEVKEERQRLISEIARVKQAAVEVEMPPQEELREGSSSTGSNQPITPLLAPAVNDELGVSPPQALGGMARENSSMLASVEIPLQKEATLPFDTAPDTNASTPAPADLPAEVLRGHHTADSFSTQPAIAEEATPGRMGTADDSDEEEDDGTSPPQLAADITTPTPSQMGQFPKSPTAEMPPVTPDSHVKPAVKAGTAAKGGGFNPRMLLPYFAVFLLGIGVAVMLQGSSGVATGN